MLHLLDLGVPARAIELHHHDVDGGGPSFMDWPCTAGYVAAIAAHLGIPLYRSWREGGFARELDRADAPTAPILFETPDEVGMAGGSGPPGTRGLFPQTSPDLRVRWCSPSLKTDVLAAAIRNQPRFKDGATLVVTGERAEESPGRARYATLEPHRTACRGRAVTHWRPVHAWTEARVWAAVERAGIRPLRLCAGLGAPVVSDLHLRLPRPMGHGAPRVSHRLPACAVREATTGKTIHRTLDVAQLADRGTPFPAALVHSDERAQAEDETWRLSIIADPWSLPAGAFGDASGPP